MKNGNGISPIYSILIMDILTSYKAINDAYLKICNVKGVIIASPRELVEFYYSTTEDENRRPLYQVILLGLFIYKLKAMGYNPEYFENEEQADEVCSYLLNEHNVHPNFAEDFAIITEALKSDDVINLGGLRDELTTFLDDLVHSEDIADPLDLHPVKFNPKLAEFIKNFYSFYLSNWEALVDIKKVHLNKPVTNKIIKALRIVKTLNDLDMTNKSH